jgi:hypothetical protein
MLNLAPDSTEINQKREQSAAPRHENFFSLPHCSSSSSKHKKRNGNERETLATQFLMRIGGGRKEIIRVNSTAYSNVLIN